MKTPAKRYMWLGVLIIAFSLGAAGTAHAQTASQLYAQGVDAYHQGDAAGAKRKLQLALDADKNFRPATALLTRIVQDQSAAGGATPAAVVPVRSLDRMVVPVEFKDTTLQSALEFLRQRIASGSGDKLQVNFVLNVPVEVANKRVTLQLDHVPVTEVLRYVGGLAGVSFEYQKYAILVTPAVGTPVPPSAAPAAKP